MDETQAFFIARKWGRIETMDLITLEGGAKIENAGVKRRRGKKEAGKRRDKWLT